MGHLREVAPGVLVSTSRFMTTNTVVIAAGGRGTDDEVVLVDPGVHLDELATIAAELADRRLRVVAGFSTHAHWDHLLWHADLGDPPRWASRRTIEDVVATRDELLREARATTAVDEARFGRVIVLDAPLAWEGPEIHLVVHDAHCPGHTALHVPERGLLVAGDMGSDVEVPLLTDGVPGPDALLAYHHGLDRLAGLDPVALAVTGHGHVCDGAGWRQRLDADRRYLDALAARRGCDDPRLRERWLDDAHHAALDRLTKASWRRWVRGRPAPATGATDAVLDALADFLGPRPGLVGAYAALPDEVALDGLVASARAERIVRRPNRPPIVADAVALPRLGDDGAVTWHLDEAPRDTHRFGIAQPPEDAPLVDPADLDVLLVPGRLFDRHGIRLGRGGGHYDRVVPRLRPGVPVVGVTVDERIVPRLPTEAHDAAMTHLATESGVRAVP